MASYLYRAFILNLKTLPELWGENQNAVSNGGKEEVGVGLLAEESVGVQDGQAGHVDLPGRRSRHRRMELDRVTRRYGEPVYLVAHRPLLTRLGSWVIKAIAIMTGIAVCWLLVQLALMVL